LLQPVPLAHVLFPSDLRKMMVHCWVVVFVSAVPFRFPTSTCGVARLLHWSVSSAPLFFLSPWLIPYNLKVWAFALHSISLVFPRRVSHNVMELLLQSKGRACLQRPSKLPSDSRVFFWRDGVMDVHSVLPDSRFVPVDVVPSSTLLFFGSPPPPKQTSSNKWLKMGIFHSDVALFPKPWIAGGNSQSRERLLSLQPPCP